MLCGGMSWQRHVPPVIFRNNSVGRCRGVTARRYVDEVLHPVLVPFMAGQCGMVFQQDNARTSCIITALLQWTGQLYILI